jgi:hypothetical protein
VSAGSGPGRRLTAAEEDQAAEMYQAKASTREVAGVLGISRSSAQQLRLRLADAGRLHAPAGPQPDDTAEHDAEHQAHDGDAIATALADAERAVAEAQAQHDTQAQVAATAAARAAEARAAADGARERVRTAVLAGEDTTALRAAQRDADEAAEAAGWIAEAEEAKLVAAVQPLTSASRLRDLAKVRADRLANYATWAQDEAGIGDLWRHAVTSARQNAEDLAAAEQRRITGRRREAELARTEADLAASCGLPAMVLPEPAATDLTAPPDMMPVTLTRARWQAQQGSTREVAVLLGQNFGALPPDTGQLAAERARLEQLRAQPVRPAPALAQPLDPRFGASVSVDQHGNPLRPPDPERPRPQQVVRPGALGFEPFPR